jgi:hypothetical protein
MKKWLLIVPVMLIAQAARAQEEPTFVCKFLGPPAHSGVIVYASNPVLVPMGEEGASRAWKCTVTCVYRTSDEREFSAFTCTHRVRLGADDEEICRDGPGLVGHPFSEPTISTATCQ